MDVDIVLESCAVQTLSVSKAPSTGELQKIIRKIKGGKKAD
jgi:ABC-type Zn uptake system ZnuABC Zn-binding protein ZnuA